MKAKGFPWFFNLALLLVVVVLVAEAVANYRTGSQLAFTDAIIALGFGLIWQRFKTSV
jgi:hypothetical protein